MIRSRSRSFGRAVYKDTANEKMGIEIQDGLRMQKPVHLFGGDT
jgi:hypothetical protein